MESDNVFQDSVEFNELPPEGMVCDDVPVNVQFDEPSSNRSNVHKGTNIVHESDKADLCNSDGDIVVGQLYETKEDLKKKLGIRAMKNNYEFRVKRSSKERPRDIIEDMRKDMCVSISYVKAWRAKEHALELVRGSPEESYSLLPSYFAVLEAKNPEIYKVDFEVGDYLNSAGYEKWTRAYFDGKRYNIMTTNIDECLNAITRDARKLPITRFLEYLRMNILQKWFYER
ncbi:hypothetical protein ACFX2G_028523 [Malus domestica]